ncbi:MAG TPA: DUF3426 domain-containing protein [Burkholderiaceae bacterium]|jgi:predicted Zn finger-like uncharacterized protein|nr:DUF3426 domain-containing protein [Burkholderiaceae bacterium]
MALATQCPHCKTTFRVAQDQLKLRAGLVRCGSCKEIFNGIEHLLPVEGAQAAPIAKATAPVEAKPAPAPAPTSAQAPTPQASAPERVPEQTPVADVNSPNIPISLLVSTPAPSSAALDFAYPDPVPEMDAAPEPEPKSAAGPESKLKTEQGSEQQAEPQQPDAVEFVEFVEVPRAIRETAVEIHDVSDTAPIDPLTRMTLVDFTDTLPPQEQAESDIGSDAAANSEPALDPDEPDPLDQVIEELKNKPLRSKKKRKPYARRPTPQTEPEEAEMEIPDPGISEAEEPDFVKQSRHQQTVGRTMRIAMSAASVILLLCLFVQATYTFRDQIAARVPESKPLLETACLLLACKVGLPTQIEALSIESDQLETLSTNKDASEFTMLLRNSGSISQAWPHLELTLNDANNIMLSRRVFAPHDYLPATQDEKKGIASNSEQTIKLYIEFSGDKPAGYHVGVFYP